MPRIAYSYSHRWVKDVMQGAERSTNPHGDRITRGYGEQAEKFARHVTELMNIPLSGPSTPKKFSLC